MAYLDTDGLDALLGDLGRIADLPEEVQWEILHAEADIVVKAHKEILDVLDLRDTGQLRDSVARKELKSGGNPAIDVAPQGYRDDGISNVEVGFIHEFGAPVRHIKASGWMEKANEACAEETLMAGLKVYDEFLKKNNL